MTVREIRRELMYKYESAEKDEFVFENDDSMNDLDNSLVNVTDELNDGHTLTVNKNEAICTKNLNIYTNRQTELSFSSASSSSLSTRTSSNSLTKSSNTILIDDDETTEDVSNINENESKVRNNNNIQDDGVPKLPFGWRTMGREEFAMKFTQINRHRMTASAIDNVVVKVYGNPTNGGSKTRCKPVTSKTNVNQRQDDQIDVETVAKLEIPGKYGWTREIVLINHQLDLDKLEKKDFNYKGLCQNISIYISLF